MITPQELADAFERNWKVIEIQTEGLAHTDSLLQPPFRGNCLNWVLGHFLESRNNVLLTLRESPLLSEALVKRYCYDSEPVYADGADVLRLERLLELLRRSQEVINALLPRLTTEELASNVHDPQGDMTLGQRLFFLYFHETYHVGQTELLRQLAGTNDKLI